jgi:hypothetical protein
MAWLVKLLGIVMVAMGAVYLVKPSMMKKYIKFWIKKNNIYFGAVLSLLFGIIFLLAASQCQVGWFIILMGIVSVVKAILLFVWGKKKAAIIADKIIHGTPTTLRTFAFVALGIGIAIVFAA